MMHRLGAALRQVAQQSGNDKQDLKLGTITSSDPAAYAVKVLTQPENEETGWMPLLGQVLGNGWGIFCLPPAGVQVAVDFEQGHPEAGVVEGALCDNTNQPPTGYQTGEIWLCHSSGSLIKLTNDGKMTVVSAGDMAINVTGAVSVTASGAVSITGSSISLNP